MSDRLVASSFTLLKYDNPFLVRDENSIKRKNGSAGSGSGSKRQDSSESLTNGPGPKPAPIPLPPSPPGGSSGKAREKRADSNRTDPNREVRDAVNLILPPKEWEENGQVWKQQVSSTPATRLDVLALQEQLDTRLKQRQARDVGICPVRRELYTQCFDELIRQVTISCAERGLLLARVRDELNLTLISYQTLYESSLAFGVRKAIQAEASRSETEEKLVHLESNAEVLQQKVKELEVEVEREKKRAREEIEALRKQHAEEVDFLQRSNLQLKGLLEGVLTPRK